MSIVIICYVISIIFPASNGPKNLDNFMGYRRYRLGEKAESWWEATDLNPSLALKLLVGWEVKIIQNQCAQKWVYAI